MSNENKPPHQKADELADACSAAIVRAPHALSPDHLYSQVLGADEYTYALFYHATLKGFTLTISHSGAAWGGQVGPLSPSPGEVEFGEIPEYTEEHREMMKRMRSFRTDPNDIDWEAFDAIARAIRERGEPDIEKIRASTS